MCLIHIRRSSVLSPSVFIYENRNEELEWLANADFSMYEGKYVAIVGKKVVAFGDNAKIVRDEAKRNFLE